MPDRADDDKKKAPQKSRLERIKDQHGEDYSPPMPPVDCGAHMLDYLWSWGPTLGDGPLTHTEIAHCQANTGIELSSWEASTLALLSRVYSSESYRATKRDYKSPWIEGVETKTNSTTNMRDAIRALAKL